MNTSKVATAPKACWSAPPGTYILPPDGRGAGAVARRAHRRELCPTIGRGLVALHLVEHAARAARVALSAGDHHPRADDRRRRAAA